MTANSTKAKTMYYVSICFRGLLLMGAIGFYFNCAWNLNQSIKSLDRISELQSVELYGFTRSELSERCHLDSRVSRHYRKGMTSLILGSILLAVHFSIATIIVAVANISARKNPPRETVEAGLEIAVTIAELEK